MSATLAAHPQVLSFLAFDFGSRRIGVATGNSLIRTATPQTTIERHGRGAAGGDRRRWSPNGSPRPWWSACRSIPTAQRTTIPRAHAASAVPLRERFGLPVYEVDERYSTTEARSGAVRATAAEAAPADPAGSTRRRRPSSWTQYLASLP